MLLVLSDIASWLTGFAERRLFSAMKIPREEVGMVEGVVGYFQNYLDNGICTTPALDKHIIDGWEPV